MVFCFCTVKAQNATKIVAGTGITVSPSSGVGVVTVSATGGGGGAGTVTNVVSTFDIITSSGVGTPVITLSRTPNLTWTNNNGFVHVGSLDSVQRILVSGTSPGLTNDYGNGILRGPEGKPSVNYNGRTLANGSGTALFDFQNSVANDSTGTGSMLFNSRLANNSTSQNTIDWQNERLLSGVGNTQVDWLNEQLDHNSTVLLDWGKHQIFGTWTNYGSFVVTNNIVLPLMTQGSIPFIGSGSTLTQNNNQLFFDNTNFRLGVGTSTPMSTVHTVATNVTVAATPIHVIDEYGTGNAAFYVARRARGTVAVPSAVTTDDSLISLNGRGYGATAFSSGRSIITGRAGENWSDVAQGAYWSFFTTTNGTITASESMRLDNLGNLGLGTTSPSTKLHVVGNTTLEGSANSIGANTSATNTFNGSIIGNTNEFGPTVSYSFRLLPSKTYFNIESISDAAGARFAVGGKDRGASFFQMDSIGGVGGLHTQGGATSMNIGDANTDQMIFTKSVNRVDITPDGSTLMARFTDTAVTLGASSSSTLTINGTTLTAANGLNINSSTLIIPASSTGTTTNTGNFTSINTITASNFISKSFTGTSKITSGTNLIMQLDVNAGAGTLQTTALMTITTNSPTAALPVVNAIYTNNNQRLDLTVSALFPAGSGAAIWTVNGSATNYFDRKIITAITTNGVHGLIQPFALYGLTNFIGTAPTPIPGEWNETRF